VVTDEYSQTIFVSYTTLTLKIIGLWAHYRTNRTLKRVCIIHIKNILTFSQK